MSMEHVNILLAGLQKTADLDYVRSGLRSGAGTGAKTIMDSDDLRIALGITGGGAGGALLASKALKKHLAKKHPMVPQSVMKHLAALKGGKVRLGGAVAGSVLGALLAQRLGDPKINPYSLMERELRASEEKTAIDPIKTLLIPAGIGLATGSAKGITEKGLERGAARILDTRLLSKLIKSKKLRGTIPWAIARGGSSALASIPYAISAAIAAQGLKDTSEKKRKKKS